MILTKKFFACNYFLACNFPQHVILTKCSKDTVLQITCKKFSSYGVRIRALGLHAKNFSVRIDRPEAYPPKRAPPNVKILWQSLSPASPPEMASGASFNQLGVDCLNSTAGRIKTGFSRFLAIKENFIPAPPLIGGGILAFVWDEIRANLAPFSSQIPTLYVFRAELEPPPRLGPIGVISWRLSERADAQNRPSESIQLRRCGMSAFKGSQTFMQSCVQEPAGSATQNRNPARTRQFSRTDCVTLQKSIVSEVHSIIFA